MWKERQNAQLESMPSRRVGCAIAEGVTKDTKLPLFYVSKLSSHGNKANLNGKPAVYRADVSSLDIIVNVLLRNFSFKAICFHMNSMK